MSDKQLLHFIWEDEASNVLDTLVDSDIRYLALQRAIEAVIETGIILEYSVPIIINDKVVYVHRVPEFFPHMLPLVVLYTEDGASNVIVEAIKIVS